MTHESDTAALAWSSVLCAAWVVSLCFFDWRWGLWFGVGAFVMLANYVTSRPRHTTPEQ